MPCLVSTDYVAIFVLVLFRWDLKINGLGLWTQVVTELY